LQATDRKRTTDTTDFRKADCGAAFGLLAFCGMAAFAFDFSLLRSAIFKTELVGRAGLPAKRDLEG
jgi:hypothetical protein